MCTANTFKYTHPTYCTTYICIPYTEKKQLREKKDNVIVLKQKEEQK